ncbi:MAG TPA: hypothetical protein VM324_07110 [Egibacteraceae bacterium]|nr:hypothetical protein [Egibacteraceae bacterium]
MWPFTRRKKTGGPEGAQAAPPPAAPARPAEPVGPVGLPPLQRTFEPLTACALTAKHATFSDDLPAWQNPARTLEPLGHEVRADAPAGLVEGITRLAAPVPRAVEGTLPLVQRTAAGTRGRPSRPGSAAPVIPPTMVYAPEVTHGRDTAPGPSPVQRAMSRSPAGEPPTAHAVATAPVAPSAPRGELVSAPPPALPVLRLPATPLEPVVSRAVDDPVDDGAPEAASPPTEAHPAEDNRVQSPAPPPSTVAVEADAETAAAPAVQGSDDVTPSASRPRATGTLDPLRPVSAPGELPPVQRAAGPTGPSLPLATPPPPAGGSRRLGLGAPIPAAPVATRSAGPPPGSPLAASAEAAQAFLDALPSSGSTADAPATADAASADAASADAAAAATAPADDVAATGGGVTGPAEGQAVQRTSRDLAPSDGGTGETAEPSAAAPLVGQRPPLGAFPEERVAPGDTQSPEVGLPVRAPRSTDGLDTASSQAPTVGSPDPGPGAGDPRLAARGASGTPPPPVLPVVQRAPVGAPGAPRTSSPAGGPPPHSEAGTPTHGPPTATEAAAPTEAATPTVVELPAAEAAAPTLAPPPPSEGAAPPSVAASSTDRPDLPPNLEEVGHAGLLGDRPLGPPSDTADSGGSPEVGPGADAPLDLALPAPAPLDFALPAPAPPDLARAEPVGPETSGTEQRAGVVQRSAEATAQPGAPLLGDSVLAAPALPEATAGFAGNRASPPSPLAAPVLGPLLGGLPLQRAVDRGVRPGAAAAAGPGAFSRRLASGPLPASPSPQAPKGSAVDPRVPSSLVAAQAPRSLPPLWSAPPAGLPPAGFGSPGLAAPGLQRSSDLAADAPGVAALAVQRTAPANGHLLAPLRSLTGPKGSAAAENGSAAGNGHHPSGNGHGALLALAVPHGGGRDAGQEGGEVSVQRVTAVGEVATSVASPSGRSTGGVVDTPPAGASGPAGPSEEAEETSVIDALDLDELTRRLGDRLVHRMKRELRLDRDRVGHLTDIRR